MKNREILKAAALLSGKEDAAVYLGGGVPLDAETAKRDAEFMLFSLRLALREIAERKSAPVTEERVQSSGFVSYGSLKKRPVKILTVNDEKIPPSAYPDGFAAPVGEITVTYRYYPEAEIEGDADLPQGVDPRAAVYFVASECAARDRMQDRAEMLAAKYERALFSASGNGKGGFLPERRWNA